MCYRLFNQHILCDSFTFYFGYDCRFRYENHTRNNARFNSLLGNVLEYCQFSSVFSTQPVNKIFIFEYCWEMIPYQKSIYDIEYRRSYSILKPLESDNVQ